MKPLFNLSKSYRQSDRRERALTDHCQKLDGFVNSAATGFHEGIDEVRQIVKKLKNGHHFVPEPISDLQVVKDEV